MPAPTNTFKAGLLGGRTQIGLWLGIAHSLKAELAATCGFDWLVVDGEHGPNDIPLILAQLQAIAAAGGNAVVRSVSDESWIIKQLLDIGAQTILVPMVQTAEHAAQIVRATRYPPRGVRGVGAALARASSFNRTADYLSTANDEICLLVQIETTTALHRLEEIAAVDGVDGIFIGPSDLAADMGYLGRPSASEVQAVVDGAIRRTIRANKPAGILTSDQRLASHYLQLGATFVAVGTDVTVLSNALAALAAKFTGSARSDKTLPASGY